MKTATLIFAAVLTIAAVPALGEDYESGMQENNPAADAGSQLIAPGLARGGSYQERGQASYEAHKDDQYNRIQNNQGDGEMLRQQNRERREYNQN